MKSIIKKIKEAANKAKASIKETWNEVKGTKQQQNRLQENCRLATSVIFVILIIFIAFKAYHECK
ncbi:hypothetical protein [Candidatus Phytoplasma meliae]|uniref:Uncharacterized protein n=1 Tax=Candidatus Phytoplasma meliae TaxID=1848402 RepID=A0ABS5CXX6_9MOLU|nr:hypothetical protein [Candidatus Phytoplasma meliae]MBP5835832.1 hypothetical protein [Candidatus Phytoplasma meliae]